jgi:protoporphyrinogen oxidase
MSVKKPYGSRKAKTKTVDTIIVGGGIAGLYSAYLIKKHSPKTSFLILEEQEDIGGRIKLVDFHGSKYAVGAGIGRANDTILKQLLKALHIPFKIIKHGRFNNNNATFLASTINVLRTRPVHNNDTVLMHLQRNIQTSLDKFITLAGYEDFLNDPAKEYLQTKNLEELFYPFDIFHVEWQKLLQFLKEYIGKNNICTNVHVNSIDQIELRDTEKSTYFLVKAKFRNLKKIHYYSCNKLILATNIQSLQKLITQNQNLYAQIHGQPFLKVLCLIKKPFWEKAKELIPSMMVTNNILRKIFPMNPSQGIYMVAYNDNHSAINLYQYSVSLKTKQQKVKLYEKLLEETLQFLLPLEDICETFWPIGTHYFDPCPNREIFLRHAQQPSKNIFVVGELVSQKQGWVEGALQSVSSVSKYFL